MSAFAELLTRQVLVSDGAMGTMLHAAGNSLDRALPELNLSNPELVSTVHDSYVAAGVDLLLTNTFGASQLRLSNSGLADRVTDINTAGARLALEAAARSSRTIFVGGSICPVVGATQRARLDPERRAAAIREQVQALLDGGVDVLVFETFGYLEELVEAVTIADTLTTVPIIAQATFSADGLTLGGETPQMVASRLGELPIVALGANCTIGPQGMLAVVEQLHEFSRLPIIAQPNAGLPRRAHDGRFEYAIDDDYFASYARRYVIGGATIIGGCCGTTPNHIRAAVEAITDLRARPAVVADTVHRRAHTGTVRAPSAAEQPGLEASLALGEFTVVAQVGARTLADLDASADFVASARTRGVELFYVTDQPSTRARADAVSVALNLHYRCGIEPIATATTWDKTIMTLQAALLGVHALGLHTIVCETGNPPLRGDYPNADGVWEVDSIGMVGLLAGLNEGRDFSGMSLGTKTTFHIGARFSPGALDLEAEISRTQAKIRAGAQFLISRPVYELDRIRHVLAELGDEAVPTLVTISPLQSFEEAELLAHEVPDVHIPTETLQRMRGGSSDEAATGLDLARGLVREVRAIAQGVVLGAAGSNALAHLLDAF